MEGWFYKDLVDRARAIIKDCEDVQLEPGSAYSKEQEKIIAYNELKEILWEGDE